METPERGFLSRLLAAIVAPLVRALDKGSLPQYGGSLTLPGLREGVKVLWQAHAIPHIVAANERDLFFAQGYLHAQERLWQMDMSRRFLTGRLAETFGNFAVPWREVSAQFQGQDSADFDFFIRVLGIRGAALASFGISTQSEVERLEAYSAGVNRYIERCGKRLPWEFRLLRYEPEPWRPEDSLTIGKGLAFLLTPAVFVRLNGLAMAAKLRAEPEKLRALFPRYPEAGLVIAGRPQRSAAGTWQFINGLFASDDWHPAGHGSNNWVIAPHLSTSGLPMLCNDPHLRLTLPSVWYLMHLKAEADPVESEGYEAWGASIPGAPCIQLGHNRWIAWGSTAAICDDAELYTEKIHPLDPDRYLRGHDWLTMTARDERIRVRGEAQTIRPVRLTAHGPVISDALPLMGSEVLTLRWTAHEPSRDSLAIYGVNRARTWHDFLQALSAQAAPALNYVYADRSGNIGYTLAGRIPIRSRPPSPLPLEGWRTENEWRGYIPFEELPRLYNPPDGALATANNRIVDGSYPYPISDLYEPPYRIQRIRALLTARRPFSTSDMAGMQMDVLSVQAKTLIESLGADLAAVTDGSQQVNAARERLLAWDGNCDVESVGAAIYHVFYHRMMANLLIPVLGERLFSAYVEIFNLSLVPVDEILKNPSSPWFQHRSRAKLVAASLRETVEELRARFGEPVDGWRWGYLHTVTFNHQLGRLSLLRPALSLGPFSSPGDATTINMGFYRHSNPYNHTVGASLRLVIDLGDWENSGFVLPSGQSGHPSSVHYRDQTELWRRGKLISISSPLELQAAKSCLTLLPG